MELQTISLALQGITTFVLGAVMGSFLLVVASRMNVRTMRGRSKCDSCATQLRARDMVPVFSYLALRGRCRDCQTRISTNTVWTEIIMGSAFAVHSFIANDVITLVVGFTVLSLCCVMALYDARSHFLPSSYLWALIVVSILYRFFGVTEIGITHTLLGYVYVCIPAGLLGLIVLISRGRWMGAGDPLLLLGLSLVIGTWQGALMTLLFASWVGLLYVAVLGLIHYGDKTLSLRHRPIAFGPCLIAGFLIAWWMSLAGLLVFV